MGLSPTTGDHLVISTLWHSCRSNNSSVAVDLIMVIFYFIAYLKLNQKIVPLTTNAFSDESATRTYLKNWEQKIFSLKSTKQIILKRSGIKNKDFNDNII